mmetsp:Transcript_69914/g.198144  ORF Transcript_69914/g.198144 Transcript_69914/m.198144 type:complete len:444 (+) Transcript_69914:365-1696(+)
MVKAVARLRRQPRTTQVEDVDVSRAGAHGEHRRRRRGRRPAHGQALDAHRPGVLRALLAPAGAQVPLVDVRVRVSRQDRVSLRREHGGDARCAHPERADRLVRGHVEEQRRAPVAEHAVEAGAAEARPLRGPRARRQAEEPRVPLRGERRDVERLAGVHVQAPHLGALAGHHDLVSAGEERRAGNGEVLEEVGGHLGVLIAVDSKKPQCLVEACGEQKVRLRVELHRLDDGRSLLRTGHNLDLSQLPDGDLPGREDGARGGRARPPARRGQRGGLVLAGRVRVRVGLRGLLGPGHTSVEPDKLLSQAALVLFARDGRLAVVPAQLAKAAPGREVHLELRVIRIGPRLLGPGALWRIGGRLARLLPRPLAQLHLPGIGLARLSPTEDNRLQLRGARILARCRRARLIGSTARAIARSRSPARGAAALPAGGHRELLPCRGATDA